MNWKGGLREAPPGSPAGRGRAEPIPRPARGPHPFSPPEFPETLAAAAAVNPCGHHAPWHWRLRRRLPYAGHVPKDGYLPGRAPEFVDDERWPSANRPQTPTSRSHPRGEPTSSAAYGMDRVVAAFAAPAHPIRAVDAGPYPPPPAPRPPRGLRAGLSDGGRWVLLSMNQLNKEGCGQVAMTPGGGLQLLSQAPTLRHTFPFPS